MQYVVLKNNLKNWGAWDFKAYQLQEHEARTAIDALDKQIPKKLNNLHIGTFSVTGTCPVCNSDIISLNDPPEHGEAETSFCRYCGQRIGWDERTLRGEE